MANLDLLMKLIASMPPEQLGQIVAQRTGVQNIGAEKLIKERHGLRIPLRPVRGDVSGRPISAPRASRRLSKMRPRR